ncbi:MAG: hypothetical protein K2K60_04530 [Clostridia bacterium]|nr:hypothetical protein [Clostridia bacterium]
MIKKRTVVAALAACIALSATFAGCSQMSTDNKRDMEQVIAEVDISKADNFPTELSAYASAVGKTTILKRDLVSAYISYGYSNSGSSSNAEIFNSLVDALVSNAVVTQYCIVELLAETAKTNANILTEYQSKTTEVEKYETLLGKDSDAVKKAKYSLYSSINSTLDSNEKTLIKEETDYAGTDTRTTPTNLETEQDDYYPKDKEGNLDYNVYTGFEGEGYNYLLGKSGAYQDDALEGTTRAFRRKAYDDYIKSLRRNYLIDESDENLADVLSLKATKNQYVSYLKAQIVSEYNDMYEAELKEALKAGDSSYVESVYDELLNSDKKLTSSDFESAMGDMSSSSFILYSPDTKDSEKFDGTNYGKYGFVYNILLPFNAKQSAELSKLKSERDKTEDDTTYYYKRNQLLKNITTVDQRSAWFNGATDYSFKPEDSFGYYGKDKDREYLFFEGNLTDSENGGRYKKLQAYDGRYSYNGKVYENDDGSYTLIGNELGIDGMLDEFSAYINYVLGSDKVTFDNGYDTENGNQAFYDIGKPNSGSNFYKDGSDKDIDYSNFLYASGKVDLGTFNRADLFNAKTQQYKAMSAVNELQFAYTTDTGVLSQYVGYSVSAYDTNYIKEFEYAAKKAVSKGAGAFTVCAGDYGWHLIYVTYTFDKGETYSPDWINNIDKEGTFENLFFEWLKTTGMSDATSRKSSQIISDFKKDSTVVKYQKRYQDLLDLG